MTVAVGRDTGYDDPTYAEGMAHLQAGRWQEAIDLSLELDKIAATLRKMDSGQTLEVRATDPSVAVDLPAWCRMVGHTLVEQQDDRYVIRRK